MRVLLVNDFERLLKRVHDELHVLDPLDVESCLAHATAALTHGVLL